MRMCVQLATPLPNLQRKLQLVAESINDGRDASPKHDFVLFNSSHHFRDLSRLWTGSCLRYTTKI